MNTAFKDARAESEPDEWLPHGYRPEVPVLVKTSRGGGQFRTNVGQSNRSLLLPLFPIEWYATCRGTEGRGTLRLLPMPVLRKAERSSREATGCTPSCAVGRGRGRRLGEPQASSSPARGLSFAYRRGPSIRVSF